LLPVLLHSSWKGRQSWSIAAHSRAEVFAKPLLKCRAPSCLFFYSMPLYTASTFVLQEQVERAARHSEQDFLHLVLCLEISGRCSHLGKMFSTFHDGSSLLADVQLFFKNTCHVRIHHSVGLLLLTPERLIVLFQIKARHHLLPFIYTQNSP